jgi:trehalose 6-phosphate synthase
MPDFISYFYKSNDEMTTSTISVARLRPPTERGVTVVSNRLPVRLERDAGGLVRARPSDGGLVSALHPVLRRRGGAWVGCSGDTGQTTAAGLEELDRFGRAAGYRLVSVPISAHEQSAYYEGACNRVLWPLLHGLVEQAAPAAADRAAYDGVNRRFARTVARGRPDVVWVHDYHLLSIGEELRRRLPHARLGFFLHIPFPRPEPLACLAWAPELLRSLACFDLIGFQTARDRENFRAWVETLEGADSALARRLDEAARVFGISVDWSRYHEAADEPAVEARAAAIRRELAGRRILLGVDRLDYTKGIPERLLAYRRLLEEDPELRGRVVLVQLAIPTRISIVEYERIRVRTEALVADINARFGTPDWEPVRYVYGSWGHDELLAWYRAADVALVTPLRDGMNLVAKEFCAANRGGGALVLSRAAGAADELGGAALLVDPEDPADIAVATRRALAMTAFERLERIRAAHAHLEQHDVHRWAARFLEVLEG